MKSTKIIKLVISISIFFLIMSYALCNKNIIFAMDEDFVSEKIYAEVNTDDAFDETCVLVILDKSVSGINKTHNNTIDLLETGKEKVIEMIELFQKFQA